MLSPLKLCVLLLTYVLPLLAVADHTHKLADPSDGSTLQSTHSSEQNNPPQDAQSDGAEGSKLQATQTVHDDPSTTIARRDFFNGYVIDWPIDGWQLDLQTMPGGWTFLPRPYNQIHYPDDNRMECGQDRIGVPDGQGGVTCQVAPSQSDVDYWKELRSEFAYANEVRRREVEADVDHVGRSFVVDNPDDEPSVAIRTAMMEFDDEMVKAEGPPEPLWHLGHNTFKDVNTEADDSTINLPITKRAKDPHIVGSPNIDLFRFEEWKLRPCPLGQQPCPDYSVYNPNGCCPTWQVSPGPLWPHLKPYSPKYAIGTEEANYGYYKRDISEVNATLTKRFEPVCMKQCWWGMQFENGHCYPAGTEAGGLFLPLEIIMKRDVPNELTMESAGNTTKCTAPRHRCRPGMHAEEFGICWPDNVPKPVENLSLGSAEDVPQADIDGHEGAQRMELQQARHVLAQVEHFRNSCKRAARVVAWMPYRSRKGWYALIGLYTVLMLINVPACAMVIILARGGNRFRRMKMLRRHWQDREEEESKWRVHDRLSDWSDDWCSARLAAGVLIAVSTAVIACSVGLTPFTIMGLAFCDWQNPWRQRWGGLIAMWVLYAAFNLLFVLWALVEVVLNGVSRWRIAKWQLIALEHENSE